MVSKTYVYTLCGYTVYKSELVGIKDSKACIWSKHNNNKDIFIVDEKTLFYSKEEAFEELTKFLKLERIKTVDTYNYEIKLIDECLEDIKNKEVFGE